MLVAYTIVVISDIIWSVQGHLLFPRIHGSDTISPMYDIPGDAGEALFLTPYIRSGNIQQGRKLARVPLTDNLHIESYSGYITVNEQYDSNMFFWYFPPMEPLLQKPPVVVWLQGGPGASSMFGLFTENGPLKIEGDNITTRDINWAMKHHMIYIDNPVGTGFSFTNDTRGYCTDEVQVGEQLHNMLTQFFKLFPDIRNNDFFISGESYAGKYIPALGYTIHKKNPTSEVKINLKGLAIGDGFVDPINMFGYDQYLYQLGFIDWNRADKLKKLQDETIQYIKDKQYLSAQTTSDNLLHLINQITNLYNYLKQNNTDFQQLYQVMNSPSLQKAIHVGRKLFKSLNNNVYHYLDADEMQSVAPWLSELLEEYRVLTYNGQLDIIVAYPLTVNYLRRLNFTGNEEYQKAPRYEWKVEGEIAGFVKQAGLLTEVMVRDAGHMVPTDQPKWAEDLITRFTHNKPFH